MWRRSTPRSAGNGGNVNTGGSVASARFVTATNPSTPTSPPRSATFRNLTRIAPTPSRPAADRGWTLGDPAGRVGIRVLEDDAHAEKPDLPASFEPRQPLERLVRDDCSVRRRLSELAASRTGEERRCPHLDGDVGDAAAEIGNGCRDLLSEAAHVRVDLRCIGEVALEGDLTTSPSRG